MNPNSSQSYPQVTKIKLKQPSFEIKPSMDLCNLYIKGIQPGLTSASLFNLFKPYGRIISAKVMEANTGGSQTGFGFVSYSSSTEAAKALIEMNEEENIQQDENKSKIPNMVVRFHEPRVPRLEHNYHQQLNLLSYSPFCCHFYIRKNQKVVPLQPMIEDLSSPSYFPNTMNQPYYYYPSYWTHQGIVYTNFISPIIPPPPPPSSSSLPSTQVTPLITGNEKKLNQQRHSWNGSLPNNNNEETITSKLIQLLKNEYNITETKNPEIFKKVLQLNRTEQSNCLNNSIYFKKKMSHFMTKE